jgi:hypothetical protein
MAGYLPHLALLPKTGYSPYREGERKSISAPNSARPSFHSSPPTLERSNTETPKNFGFHGHSPNPSASFRTSKLPHSLIKATPHPRDNATPIPACLNESYSSSPQSPRNQAPSTPSPALGRTASIRPRSPFPFFKHGRHGSTEPADSKPKRNKLVKKTSISQPTFVMVSPHTARAERATMEAGAAELGLQLADAVAEMEVGPVKVLGADGASATAVWADADNGAEASDENSKQTKRWSRAPLLPDFDFSSASSNSKPLFDSMPEEAIAQDSESAKAPAEITSIVSDLRHAAAQAHNTTKLTSTDASKSTYHCSIHAPNSASHLAVERACCEIVTEAGGRVLDSYSFPGGFMFRIPSNVPEPITSCELRARGVRIELEKWSEFPLPNFDGLRLNPPSRTFNEEWLAVHSEAAQVEADERLRDESNAQKRVQTWNTALTAWEKSKGKQTPQGTPKRHNTVKESFMSSKGATEGSRRCLPASHRNTISLVGSLGTIRRCGQEESGAIENVSFTPRSAKTSQGNSKHRFTVVSDVPDSEDGSGGEEWESVRSELDG